MSSTLWHSLMLLGTALIAAPSPAQTVWNVVGDDSPAPWSLAPWIAQAAPGDILLIDGSQGGFQPFNLTKGLTLIALVPTSVFGYAGTGAPVVWDTTISVPAGQRARIVGLRFDPGDDPGFVRGQTVTVSGDVAFEDCRFGPGRPSLVVGGGTVRFRQCDVEGVPYLTGGMNVAGGIVTLSECNVTGGPAYWENFPGIMWASQTGLKIFGGTVVATHCTIRGGDGRYDKGQTALSPPSPAIVMSGSTSRLWLSDSTLIGGSGLLPPHLAWLNGPGATALVGPSTAPSFAAIARTQLTGGTGVPVGLGSTGNTVTDPELLGFVMSTDLQRGQPATLTVVPGAATGPLAIVYGIDSSFGSDPLVQEPLQGPGSPWITLAIAWTPSAGTPASLTFVVPSSPSLLGAEAWFQALQLTSTGARASASVGGVVR